MRKLILITLTNLTLCCGAIAAQSDYEAAFLAAKENPTDKAKVEAFAKLLPKHGDRYVVDGDVLVTDRQLVGYLMEHSAPAAPVKGELIVNIADGHLDKWGRDERILTYQIDTAGFGDKTDMVRKNLAAAAKEWTNACGKKCGIRFQEHTGEGEPTFKVRKVSGAPFIAAAFFPSTAPIDRVLEVDDQYFTTTFDKVGVFRHELGHVLGYRHEHIQGIPGCKQEGGERKAITPYDGKSVMHYLCGGAGNPKLTLSSQDKDGHTQNYSTD
ncbi:hypothetical protein A1353_00545 [Methylomonas methanica]|uniref:Peptidase metallopeptidase domain-containing protein n=1 Tax=Methylomonas methanica TaxID=421 RepID=A0A177M7Z8_METMH|nr:hypothetical protein [Methylomonas methanica]OAI01741.1 hypothetical protein A1353_00545 [Methylomonas methanica]